MANWDNVKQSVANFQAVLGLTFPQPEQAQEQTLPSRRASQHDKL